MAGKVAPWPAWVMASADGVDVGSDKHKPVFFHTGLSKRESSIGNGAPLHQAYRYNSRSRGALLSVRHPF